MAKMKGGEGGRGRGRGKRRRRRRRGPHRNPKETEKNQIAKNEQCPQKTKGKGGRRGKQKKKKKKKGGRGISFLLQRKEQTKEQ